MTFDPPERKAEGEPRRFLHVIDVTLHQRRIDCMVGIDMSGCREQIVTGLHSVMSAVMSAFLSGGSKVIFGIIAWKKGEPEDEATCTCISLQKVASLYTHTCTCIRT